MKRYMFWAAFALASLLHAQNPSEIIKDAVAVWPMQTAASLDGKANATVSGNVVLGKALVGADKDASLAAGSDAYVGEFSGGFLDAGQGANGQLALSGDQATVLLRMRAQQWPLPNGELFSKHGGHKQTAFNLFSARGELGFEIGAQDKDGLAGQVRIPANALKKDTWYDVVARYNGKELTIFVDGLPVNTAPARGLLRTNTQPLQIGKAMRGQIDHAALWSRALSNAEIAALSKHSGDTSARQSAMRAKIEAQTGKDNLTTVDEIRGARQLRAKLAADHYRPRYHLTTPEGYWNDINGTLFWKGRYHVMFLGRQAPDAKTVLEGKDSPRQRETWMHASSPDMVNWVHHTPAMTPVFDGTMGRGLWSGGAIAGASVPTLIYYIHNQGIGVSTADDPADPELIKWTANPHNPVIAVEGAPAEVVVFDPAAWREDDGTYYALVGNKNKRPGYEGDSTSLYRSQDLVNWEYRGPFYKSDRKWTEAMADAACPDFFPIGNGKHMLLMHMHRPLFVAAYYIGTWDRENEQFIPEQFSMMNWPGGSLFAPETLLDDKGRRIFWGSVRGPLSTSDAWRTTATLPRVISLDNDNVLQINPVPELESLRHNERSWRDLQVSGLQTIEGVAGDMMEIRARILPGAAREFGIVVRRSPNGEEQMPVIINLDKNTVYTDLSKASLNPKVRYRKSDVKEVMDALPEAERFVQRQEAPFTLKAGEAVDLRIFIDKSLIEIFVNGRQCLTQVIYPTRDDAKGIALVSDAPMTVEQLQVWDMHPTQ